MSVDKVHLRHYILYEFQKGSNASVACKNLSAAFGKDIVYARTCQRWFNKFRSGDLSLQESDRSGRPFEIDNDTRYIISNSSKTKYPLTKNTALFVVGYERFSVLRVTETGENHQRGSILQSAG
ncbi:hypothetical protein TNCV_499481 [Trichonephila clavipes]|nr:hypothetical protein TNCV_499481 [Trichonephila clavipes]